MQREEWHADITITEELVKSCLQAQFPSLMPIKTIKNIGEGWDNKVFLINDNLIFRFPRRKIAVELLEHENKILTKLPSFSPLAIPTPQYLGQPSSYYPYPFQGYHLIKGVAACHAQLSLQDRIASLPAMADFLKQLHRINEQQALEMGVEAQAFDSAAITKTVQTLNKRVSKIIERRLCPINKNCFQQEINAIQQLPLSFTDRCLIHGDLDSRHLLFDNGKLTGIIDWGDMGISHKATDLAIIWIFYPANCHPSFFAMYGAVDAATWQYARFIGLYTAFTSLLYGHDIGDALLVLDAINTLKRINPNLLII